MKRDGVRQPLGYLNFLSLRIDVVVLANFGGRQPRCSTGCSEAPREMVGCAEIVKAGFAMVRDRTVGGDANPNTLHKPPRSG